jgi:hypothetical protein
VGATPIQLGDPLSEDTVVFRAFSLPGHRKREKKVRYQAFLRGEDHNDGISLGRTPDAAVAELEVNFGYCSIRVGDIRSLKYNLNVRPDLGNPDHLILCGVPVLMESDRDRGLATEIAGELARISKLETSDPYPPPKREEELPSPSSSTTHS